MIGIRSFLNNLKGGDRDLEKCIEVLIDLQRKSTPDRPAPILEILSVIKVENPVLFDRLKERTVNYRSLNFLMDISIDYSTAKKRLGLDR